MSSVAQRLTEVRARIEAAATAAGRDPRSVALVAVSKTKPAEAIRQAYAAGQRAFGENYAQELAQKAEELADLPDIEWHFIGHLQTNKAKYVARAAHVVHAVDTEPLARELGRRVAMAGRPRLRALVEVKLSYEPTKHGARPEDLEDVLRAVEAEPSLLLTGLMTLPEDAADKASQAFATLASLRLLHGGSERLPELSMGMTGDLELAIARGATMVRVGTAIFGAR
jgi:hypothetical protein